MSGGTGRAAELREAFDRSFADVVRPAGAQGGRVLLVRAGGAPCALRLADVAGLHARPRIVRLPGATGGFLGLAGLRGAVLPVWDLGTAAGGAPSEARWLAVAAGTDALALAFDAYEGTVELPDGGLAGAGNARPFLAGMVAGPEGPRPVLDLPSIVQDIARRAGTGRAPKEHGPT